MCEHDNVTQSLNKDKPGGREGRRMTVSCRCVVGLPPSSVVPPLFSPLTHRANPMMLTQFSGLSVRLR